MAKWIKPELDDLGEAPEALIEVATAALTGAQWREKRSPKQAFWVADFHGPLPFNGYQRAFFIKLEPGGHVHEHNDGYAGRTYHVPLVTNEAATMHFRLADGYGRETVVDHHLETTRLYEIDRTKPHWSENGGDTDRVHLVIETTV